LEADLDAIARAVGTAGKRAKQRKEHERQRQAWRAAIEAQRAKEDEGTHENA